jgi:hypothetical protein
MLKNICVNCETAKNCPLLEVVKGRPVASCWYHEEREIKRAKGNAIFGRG